MSHPRPTHPGQSWTSSTTTWTASWSSPSPARSNWDRPSTPQSSHRRIDRSRGEPCILDLTKLTFLGSTRLTALVDATRHANARREPLRIVVDANRPVIRPIEVTGLDDVLKLYHSVDETVKAGMPR